MGRTLLGELRKLLHPVAAIMIIVCFAYILTDARTTYYYAQLQTPVAVIASDHIKQEAAGCLDPHGGAISEQCQQKLDDAALNDHFAGNGIKLGRVTNALSTWPGMLRFVSHQLATGVGWILLGVLLALHVAGEWSSRTAASTFMATGSYRRFWLAKIGSIWLAMIAIALAGTTVLWLAKSTFIGKAGIPDPVNQPGDPSTWHLAALPPDASWSSWAASSGVLGITAIIWALFIIAGVAVAALIRRTLIMVVVWIAALSAVLSLARYSGDTNYSPIGVIGQVLHLNQTPFGVRDTRLWEVPGAPGFIQDTARTITIDTGQVLAWIAIPLALALVASAIFQRRRIVG
jgi:hypothetical protein